MRDGQIVIRPMMYLALTYDHRLIDGREAVSFLVRVKECIENPERMLLDAQCSSSSAEIFPPSAVRGILVMIRMLQVREAEIDLMRSQEQRYAGLRARMVEFEQRLAKWEAAQ